MAVKQDSLLASDARTAQSKQGIGAIPCVCVQIRGGTLEAAVAKPVP
jgi:hypothetical protein